MIASLDARGAEVEAVMLGDVHGFDIARSAYAKGVTRAADPNARLLAAKTYAAFLSEHQARLAVERYLEREWPEELAEAFLAMTLADIGGPVGYDAGAAGAEPMQEVIADWYRLRRSGGLAHTLIEPARLGAYQELVRLYAEREFAPDSPEARLQSFVSMLGSYLASDGATRFFVCLDEEPFSPQAAEDAAEPSGAIPDWVES